MIFRILLPLFLAAASWADDGVSLTLRPSKGTEGKAGTFADETITVGDLKRQYRLVVPKSAVGKKPVPLVFAFHGFLVDSKDVMPQYSQLSKLAEKKGFIIVYPNARYRTWPLVERLAKADFELFDALYKRITTKYNVNLNRVYLVGMSNGGYFTHLLAMQRPDKIAALCCHSGGIGFVQYSKTPPKRKFAALIVHGARDGIVNISEARKTRDVYKKWKHPVKYVEVPRLGHFWARRVNINAQIWTFFQNNPAKQ